MSGDVGVRRVGQINNLLVAGSTRVVIRQDSLSLLSLGQLCTERINEGLENSVRKLQFNKHLNFGIYTHKNNLYSETRYTL